MPKDIYQSSSVTKNGKRYDLNELSFVFDCPYCEYLLTTLDGEAAIATRDIHHATAHPEHHIPTITADAKERIDRLFTDMRIRSSLPVGALRRS